MRRTCACINEARLMKASDDELSKSLVNLLLRDVKLALTVVSPTVVVLVLVVAWVVPMVLDVVANMVVLIWEVVVEASDNAGDVDFNRVVVGEAVVVWEVVVGVSDVVATEVVGDTKALVDVSPEIVVTAVDACALVVVSTWVV